MKQSAIRIPILVGIVLSARAWCAAGDDPSVLLARLDKAGAAFHGMSAKVRRVQHTAAVNEDTVDAGTILLKRVHAKDVRMLIDLSEPDPKTVAFQGHTVEVYYPKMHSVDEIDVSKQRELLEQLFLLGFGTSRADLQAAYNVRLVGASTLAGQKTEILELVPKSKEVVQHLLKIEIWVAENGYPLQQKFYQRGGDYELATYSDMKINPELPESELKLKVPKGTKRNYPQKN